MRKFTWPTLRTKSHWLALVTSFIILATTISLTLFSPVEGLALNGEVQSSPFFVLGSYQSPQRCRECHPAEFQDWSDTSHARASFDPIFQTYLQQVEKPGECFTCHATGYDTTTGQFVLAGVTCEACHGPYRPEHPQESMIIAASAEMCGNCHTSTLFEWRASRHGAVGVTCIDCHEVHTQRTRAATTTLSLCTTCHQEQIQDSTHTIHNETDVHCIDCHLAHPNNNGSQAMKGQAITGHSFAVFVKTCQDCHADASIPNIAVP